MVVSERNGNPEAKSEEDVRFDSDSASDPHGSEAEVLANADRRFNPRSL